MSSLTHTALSASTFGSWHGYAPSTPHFSSYFLPIVRPSLTFSDKSGFGAAHDDGFVDRMFHGNRIGERDSLCIQCTVGRNRNTHGESGPSLAHICHNIELCFFEVCVQNLGRPAGLSLYGFVSAAFEAFSCGYTREQVSLQLTFGSAAMHEFEVGTAGSRLTSVEEHYRAKWLDTIYTTLQILELKEGPCKSATHTDFYLYSTIQNIIQGQESGDEQRIINFDRGLATRGASGGVISEKVVVAPQMVPISQLVLLTLKVVNEHKKEP
ncbi:hypothetical protein KP509_09G083900 [Ceratopteris richardii]|uniref:Uncharacterized protein n=1 Tax=Ceratopteris richardii TaxID=49495 RepID=A0A8T2U6C9_CERRI|nr:hypothetical protein KP509_09G083900 [Ceratopteris richardii]